jgi:hypothetical protein
MLAKAALTMALLLTPTPGSAGPPSAAAPLEKAAIPQAAVLAQASPRGLQKRISLGKRDDAQLYGADPMATKPPGAPGGRGPTRVDLTDVIDLRLHAAPIRGAAVPGRRMGHGDVVFSVPVSEALDLRTGVRVDYDSSPASQDFDADPIPTLGVGVKF